MVGLLSVETAQGKSRGGLVGAARVDDELRRCLGLGLLLLLLREERGRRGPVGLVVAWHVLALVVLGLELGVGGLGDVARGDDKRLVERVDLVLERGAHLLESRARVRVL